MRCTYEDGVRLVCLCVRAENHALSAVVPNFTETHIPTNITLRAPLFMPFAAQCFLDVYFYGSTVLPAYYLSPTVMQCGLEALRWPYGHYNISIAYNATGAPPGPAISNFFSTGTCLIIVQRVASTTAHS